ncbi:MAG: glycerol-3-phosphate 1-O-acyltransferase PlsY [Rhodospirillales bacterium]
MGDFFDHTLVAAVVGYLAGSIPFGLLLTRLAGLGDIRRVGSGNIGATNVLRTGNKGLALATLILDGLKGALPVLLFTGDAGASAWAPMIAGLAAVIGHNFPVWLRFRGGKGVATTLGVLTALAWPVGLAAAAVWLAAARLFRYSSLAALVALSSAPFWMLWFADGRRAMLAAVLAVIAVIRHVDNIRRLAAGEESKIGGKPGDADRPRGP